MSTVAVLLAHGSPDPRSGQAVRRTAAAVARRTGTTVVVAFLDHEHPGLVDAVPADATSVVVLPLLLSAAFHARVDVPTAVEALTLARPGLQVEVRDPLGHPPAVLDSLLLRATGPAVVVAAGTRVDTERAAFARAVGEASRRTRVVARAAFATGPGPSVQDSLQDGAVVLPWLLAPGRLLDAVVEAGEGHRVVGNGLLGEPTMVAEISARLAA